MIFVGDDWAEDHHDLHVMDTAGNRLAARRLPEGLAGIGRLHELLAQLSYIPSGALGVECRRNDAREKLDPDEALLRDSQAMLGPPAWLSS